MLADLARHIALAQQLQHPDTDIDAFVERNTEKAMEVWRGDEELDSPYLTGDLLDLRSWAHDGFALAAPEQILCTADCPGLCPVCAVALRDAGAGHHHDSAPDRRWAKLAELRLE